MPPSASAVRTAPRILSAGVRSEELGDRDFERLSRLIGEEVGIKLPQGKRLMLEGRLRKRVRHLGYSGVSEYCRFLFEADGLETELPHLIDVVTTNKTDFFREPDHFAWLTGRIVPELLTARRGGGTPFLKVWSAACSNGAEPYTAAMVLAELAREVGGFRFAVLGTDISTQVLEHGRRAVYAEAAVEPVPEALRRRYLLTSKAGAREVRIAPELRRLVRFARLNLMSQTYPFDRDVDVIFLRNVLIYFERQTQEAVIRRLAGHLRPGGYLILGHSESMIGTHMRLRQCAPSVFQKT
ncbi:MAG: CheR family methyltransferase [Phenylobacterium sp.]|jgi:chemotaxis protein methyltransferase CheR|uniref:CheR family methyltransferase n=1 Tax=Phenylobacterium sp. TaxID=1871053 RepID=UPI00391D6ADF